MQPAALFYTIGHSTTPLDRFIGYLNQAEIRLIVDVRSIPRSRTNPQYNIDSFPGALGQAGIGYLHLLDLGGRRSKSKTVPPEVNAFWTHPAFHSYADYALTPAFHNGLTQLRAAGRGARCAIMCSEAVWWRCHRRIVTDYLLAAKADVRHIVTGRIEPASLTPAAEIGPDGLIRYPIRAKD